MKASNLITAIISYLLVFQWFQTPGGNYASAMMICGDKNIETHSFTDPVSTSRMENKFAVSPMASIARW